jgi:ribosomal protein S18 acetylase RimI-like enzyme
MNNFIQIQPISAKKTYAIRQLELRKGRPISDCVFEGDELPTTFHLEAILNEEQVGIVSAFKNKHPEFEFNNSYQIRGVAVSNHLQGNGIGKKLMEGIEQFLMEKKVSFLWLNARENAVPFYESIAYTLHGNAFNIPSIGIHYLYYKRL